MTTRVTAMEAGGSRERSYATRLIPASEATPQLIRAWRDLAGRAAEPNPFAEPAVVLPAATHLTERGRLLLLTAWDGDRLDALLPVNRLGLRLGPGHLPLPMLAAATSPYRPLSTPLVDAERTAQAVSALLTPGTSRRLSAAGLVFRHLGDDGPVAGAIDAALASRGQQAVRLKTYQRAVLRADSPIPQDKNRRRRLRKMEESRERLDASIGQSAVVDRSDDPAAVEDFLRLEAAGWKGRAGTAMACRPAHAAWFREACAGLRAEGRLSLLVMRAPAGDVAMECIFVAGGVGFHLKTAYDENYAEHRPGMLLDVHVTQQIAHDPVAVHDSCTVSDNVWMNQLWPDRRTLSSVVVPLPGRTGSAAANGARLAWAAVSKARSALSAPSRKIRR